MYILNDLKGLLIFKQSTNLCLDTSPIHLKIFFILMKTKRLRAFPNSLLCRMGWYKVLSYPILRLYNRAPQRQCYCNVMTEINTSIAFIFPLGFHLQHNRLGWCNFCTSRLGIHSVALWTYPLNREQCECGVWKHNATNAGIKLISVCEC